MPQDYEDALVNELLNVDQPSMMGGTDIVGGASVVRRQPSNIENLIAGIPVTTVGIGATVDLNVPVNRPFRARRLVLEGFVLPGTRIESIKVGNVEQIINNNPIVAEAYAADAYASLLKGDTAQPGVGIDIRVTNSSGAAIALQGAFFGEAAT